MKHISLLSAEIKNFRSIKHASIQFPQDAGLRFIRGINLDEPQLGANGVGKSSLWEAVHWCLTGTGSKGTKVSTLTTWGEDESFVITKWKVNDLYVDVTRSGPPTKLYISPFYDLKNIPKASALAEQKQLDNILGLSKLRFQHSVLFSQGQRLFPDLSIPERGELLEEVLNLQFWSKCVDTATSELTSTDKELNLANNDLARLEGNLQGLETLESLEAKSRQWTSDQYQKIERLKTQATTWEFEKENTIYELKDKSEKFNDTIAFELKQIEEQEQQWQKEHDAKISGKIDELQALETETNKLAEITQQKNNSKKQLLDAHSRTNQITASLAVKQSTLNKAEAEFLFWKETNVCSACKQPITEEHRQSYVQPLLHQIQDLLRLIPLDNKDQVSNNLLIEYFTTEVSELTSKESVLLAQAKQAALLEKEIDSLLKTTSPFAAQKTQTKTRLNPYIAEIQKAEQQTNPHTSAIDIESKTINPFDQAIISNKEKRKWISEALEINKSKIQGINEKATMLEYWKNGFKRLRIFLMHRVLAALEIEINSAASTLGLIDYSIKLASETETKSGTIKLGIQICISSPTSTNVPWDSWSGGESQRLRLALALGVASLIQRAAGVEWNFEVWDEPSSHLSVEGVEQLMEMLEFRANSNNKSIYVVDHSPLAFSNFASTWTAIKEKETGTRFEYN